VIMMSVEFGMANQFILDLSVNTKRGQRTKAQNGWLPTKAPIGYLNNQYNMPDKEPITKTLNDLILLKNFGTSFLKRNVRWTNFISLPIRWGLLVTQIKLMHAVHFIGCFVIHSIMAVLNGMAECSMVNMNR